MGRNLCKVLPDITARGQFEVTLRQLPLHVVDQALPGIIERNLAGLDKLLEPLRLAFVALPRKQGIVLPCIVVLDFARVADARVGTVAWAQHGIGKVRCTMTAFNAVRFRVKPGRDQEFLDAHKKVQANWPGMLHANIIKTGERTYCIIAEWSDTRRTGLSPARTLPE